MKEKLTREQRYIRAAERAAQCSSQRRALFYAVRKLNRPFRFGLVKNVIGGAG